MSRSGSKPALLPIIAAICAVTSVGIGLSLSIPLLSILFEQRGVSGFWIGINTAMSGLAAIIVGPYITPLAIRYGVSRLLMVSLLLASASLMALYWVTDFAATFPVRLIFHAAITAIIILSEFWINVVVNPKQRGLFLGLYTTMLSLGFVAGPTILRFTDIDSAAPFILGSLAILVAFIPVVMASKHSPDVHKESETSWWRFIFLSPLAMGAVFVFGIAESGLLAIFPIYGLRIGYSNELVVTFLIAMGLGNVLFQIPIGLLIDRTSKQGLTIVFALIGFLGAVIIPFVSQNSNLIYVVIFLWGGIIPGLYTLGLTRLGIQYKGSDLASANAAFIMVYSFGNFIGPPAIGMGMEIWNPHGSMGVIGAAFGLFALFAIAKTLIKQRNFQTKEDSNV